MNDLTLLQDLFGNSEQTKLMICTVIFCLVFTAPAKWRVELRAKIGQYRNRCFTTNLDRIGARLSSKLNTNSLYFVFILIIFHTVGYLSNSYVNFGSSIKLVVLLSHIRSHMGPGTRWSHRTGHQPIGDQPRTNESYSLNWSAIGQ